MDHNSLVEALQSQESYKNTNQIKEGIKLNNLQQMEICVKTINEILNNKSGSQWAQLLAARLCKETMDMQNQQFTRIVQVQLLPIFEQIGMFKAEETDERRGRYYFSNDPSKNEASIGNSLFRLILDCIQVWSVWYPIDPSTGKPSQFKIVYNRLINSKVVFPKLSYFKEEQLKPFQMLHSAILPETKVIVQQDIRPVSHSQRDFQYAPPLVSVNSQRHSVSRDSKLKQFLNEYRKNIQNLESLLKTETSQGSDELRLLILQLQERDKEAESLLIELVEVNTSGDDPIFEEIVTKQEICSQVYRDYQSVIQNTMTFVNFRIKCLNLIKSLVNYSTPQAPENYSQSQAENQKENVKRQSSEIEKQQKIFEEQRIEQERLQQQQILEQQRIQQLKLEQQKQEQQRIEKLKIEEQRKEEQRQEEQKREEQRQYLLKLEQQKQESEKLEQLRLDQLKLQEKQKMEKEKKEQELQDQQKFDLQRKQSQLEKEKREHETQEQNRVNQLLNKTQSKLVQDQKIREQQIQDQIKINQLLGKSSSKDININNNDYEPIIVPDSNDGIPDIKTFQTSNATRQHSSDKQIINAQPPLSTIREDKHEIEDRQDKNKIQIHASYKPQVGNLHQVGNSSKKLEINQQSYQHTPIRPVTLVQSQQLQHSNNQNSNINVMQEKIDQKQFDLIQQLNSKNQDLELSKLNLEKQIRQIEILLDEKDSEIQKQSYKLNEVLKEKDQLQAIIEQNEKEMQNLSQNFASQLAVLTQQNQTLREELSEKQKNITKIIESVDKSNNQEIEQILQLTQENSDLLQQNKLQKIQIETLQKQILDLDSQKFLNKNQSDQINDLQKQILMVQEKNFQLNDQRDSIYLKDRDDIINLTRENAQLLQENKFKNNQIQNLQKQLQDSESKCQEFQKIINTQQQSSQQEVQKEIKSQQRNRTSSSRQVENETKGNLFFNPQKDCISRNIEPINLERISDQKSQTNPSFQRNLKNLPPTSQLKFKKPSDYQVTYTNQKWVSQMDFSDVFGGVTQNRNQRSNSVPRKITMNTAVGMYPNKYKEIIYPFTSAIDYFKSKGYKSLQGRAVSTSEDFISYNSPDLRQNLKMALFYKKHALIKTGTIKVGSDIEQQIPGVKVTLQVFAGPEVDETEVIFTQYCRGLVCDSQDQSINLTVSQIHPAKIEIYYKLQNVSQFHHIPSCQLDLQQEFQQFHIPISILQFLEINKTSLQLYRKVWQTCKAYLSRSEIFPLNSSIFTDIHSILDQIMIFIPELGTFYQNLQTERREDFLIGIGSYKMGFICNLVRTTSKFIVRITLRPTIEAIIYVAQYEGTPNNRLVEQIIRQIQFVLSD